MEVLNTIDSLREMLEKPKQFMGITFGLNREECILMLRKIHAQLPDDMKEAEKIKRDSERIVDSAKDDAHLTLERARGEANRLIDAAKREGERILDEARIERERMLNESEVLKAAKEEAEAILSEAQTEAARMKRGADEYAFEVLLRLENVAGKIMSTIERGKQEIQKTAGSPRQGSP
jgi:cell division septum initiation protein DivIVA